jgi:Na+-translocating ferredoxin:NAD+ oxidoreductase subunit B
MSEMSRRELLGHAARGATLLGLAGTAGYLVKKAGAEGVWQLDVNRCVNTRLGAVNVPVCDKCATACVLALSAVRAVNNHAICGRCYICPGYFDIKSAVNEQGLPSAKLCPRDAIIRKPIGDVDPRDPANNYYEYIIDEKKCNGCGKCVMGCKEPAGLSSIRLEVRHNLCVDCNRCSIAQACPEDAYVRQTTPPGPLAHTPGAQSEL